MKKIFLTGILLVLIMGFVYYLFTKSQTINQSKKQTSSTVLSPAVISITPQKSESTSKKTSQSIFVPYWSINSDLQKSDYDKYIYFGITANSQGIDQKEAGYTGLSAYVKIAEGKNSYLTLRLLDNDFNRQLLGDEELQNKIIEQTMMLVKENNFKGVVLDLELFSLFDGDIKNQINSFVKRFYTAAKADYKSLSMAIYGDVFFRKRPFDLTFISANTDEVLIMVYDFHKVIGEPGPNFPYNVGPDDNYSFKQMITDFVRVVPKEKISVIYGMYGYDWQVDEKMRPISQAKALTLNQIREKFLDGETSATKCAIENCVIKKDEESKETEIDYTISSSTPDDMGIYRIDYHVVWYEDEESAKIKTDYLINQGISNVGYWTYGYF